VDILTRHFDSDDGEHHEIKFISGGDLWWPQIGRYHDSLHMLLNKADIDNLSDDELISLCRYVAENYEEMTKETFAALNNHVFHNRRPSLGSTNTKRDNSGYIYLLHGQDGHGDIYKIGRTTREPTDRVAEIRPHLPFETELIGYIRCNNAPAFESHLHERLDRYHVRGEWFRLPYETVETFCNHQGGRKECKQDGELQQGRLDIHADTDMGRL